MEKLADYSVHRISTHELRNTGDYNAISETLDTLDLVESTKEYCGVRAASRERGAASRGRLRHHQAGERAN